VSVRNTRLNPGILRSLAAKLLYVTPRFGIGDGYAVYRGPAAAGSLHRHATFQIVVGGAKEVAVLDAMGVRHHAPALVVAPMQRHRLLDTPDAVIYFVEPHCVFADRLRRDYRDGVTAAPELRGLTEGDIRPSGGQQSDELDPRLVQALNALTDFNIPLPNLAATVGLSPQRLRGLARQQLGMPLARWRVWTRLRRAAEALAEGRPLAEAATTAGFADQAHFTRQMREMMGLTPAAVLPLVRDHSLRAT
jgi:AraC-like DNA-binding protein